MPINLLQMYKYVGKSVSTAFGYNSFGYHIHEVDYNKSNTQTQDKKPFWGDKN